MLQYYSCLAYGKLQLRLRNLKGLSICPVDKILAGYVLKQRIK